MRPGFQRARLSWLAAAILVFAFLSLLSLAFAHEHWISDERLQDPVSGQWCCSLNDCAEEPENVERVEGGFLIVSTREIIPTARVIWKSPGGWWRCRFLTDNKTRCLIGPPQGS